MIHLQEVPFVRVVAEAAQEQRIMSPGSCDGVKQWIKRIERRNLMQANEQVIRQASEVLIRRLNRSAPVIGK
ncbi:hypothetical protein E5161_11735 [Cohnella pontilimi]|uniref:Uncharacterized protein n=1 Tax=Cohnella pontilimi TaxID=2564100 RepID=A0A4U0FAU3_9BACL|nr:hypothetical protein [Cohnella pontilimi]TJY41867.1 hypothetical protein E5161_11735 [Cohnella pontilimi]